jgi:uncharacterized protein
MTKAKNALSTIKVRYEDRLAILLAALLHDASDAKMWPGISSNQNEINILNDLMEDDSITSEIKDLTIEMINYVSTRNNGDTIPERAHKRPWLLIPRYADRCAALGSIGIKRCHEYTMTKRRPLFTDKTLRATTEEELWRIATPKRYQAYQNKAKESESMVDHFYDKLLHIGKADTMNPYLNEELRKGIQPMIDFCISFGKTGKIPLMDETPLVDSNNP